VGINNRKEQDWWLLCSTTPLVWNQITYTSPTHCQSRVSGFSSEGFTSDADHMLSMIERGKEGRDVGRPRRGLPVVDPTLSAFPVIVHLHQQNYSGSTPRASTRGAPTKYMIAMIGRSALSRDRRPSRPYLQEPGGLFVGAIKRLDSRRCWRVVARVSVVNLTTTVVVPLSTPAPRSWLSCGG